MVVSPSVFLFSFCCFACGNEVRMFCVLHVAKALWGPGAVLWLLHQWQPGHVAAACEERDCELSALCGALPQLPHRQRSREGQESGSACSMYSLSYNPVMYFVVVVVDIKHWSHLTKSACPMVKYQYFSYEKSAWSGKVILYSNFKNIKY